MPFVLFDIPWFLSYKGLKLLYLNMEKILKEIGKVADKIGFPCYVVGGYVRDKLLCIPNDDIDIMVVGEGIIMANEFAKEVGVKDVIVYPTYGTAAVKYKDLDIEFVGARKESYTRGSRKPKVEVGTLQDDLERRDFTINAMAISLNSKSYGEIVDLFGGQEDLRRGIIRTPTNPDQTFIDDPLRMLRCIRFACRLGFDIEDDTWKVICDSAEEIKNISAERIICEFEKNTSL